MRVKMITTAAGPDGVFLAGQVVDIEEKLAKAFIAGGYAKTVEKVERSVVESASIEAPEKAVLPNAKRKKVKQHGAGTGNSSDS
jgi:hypothetical protein